MKLIHKGYCAINEIGCCSCGAEREVRKVVCSFCREYYVPENYGDRHGCELEKSVDSFRREVQEQKAKAEEHRDFTHTCYACGNIWLGDGVGASCPKCQSQVTSYRLSVLPDIEKQQRKPERETVNHPPHYTFGKYEVIDVLEDWFAGEPHLWQVGKYIARAMRKGEELKDLKKARWFLERKIAKLEEKTKK